MHTNVLVVLKKSEKGHNTVGNGNTEKVYYFICYKQYVAERVKESNVTSGLIKPSRRSPAGGAAGCASAPRSPSGSFLLSTVITVGSNRGTKARDSGASQPLEAAPLRALVR